MKSDWLTAASFERMHEIVSSINTLSIHAKLTLAGVPDPTPEGQISAARRRLLSLFERLKSVIAAAEQRTDGAVLGADPQLGELALQFLTKREGGRRPVTPKLSSVKLSHLVRSDQPEDLRRLVPYLEELRALVEAATRGDLAGILGAR